MPKSLHCYHTAATMFPSNSAKSRKNKVDYVKHSDFSSDSRYEYMHKDNQSVELLSLGKRVCHCMSTSISGCPIYLIVAAVWSMCRGQQVGLLLQLLLYPFCFQESVGEEAANLLTFMSMAAMHADASGELGTPVWHTSYRFLLLNSETSLFDLITCFWRVVLPLKEIVI